MLSGAMISRLLLRGLVEWRWCKTGDEDWRCEWDQNEAPEMLLYVIGGVDLRLTGTHSRSSSPACRCRPCPSRASAAADPSCTVEVPPDRFEELVADALDELPAPLTRAMDNVVVLVDDRHPEEPDLLGVYEGVALTERYSDYGGVLPDRITLYRLALGDVCEDEDEVVEEVTITVVHEIAHHFGIDEERLHALGWG